MPSVYRSFREQKILCLCLVFLLFGGITIVSAHAPLGVGSNDDIANATYFDTPDKSYVLYTELYKGGEAQYYRFPLKKDEILEAIANMTVLEVSELVKAMESR